MTIGLTGCLAVAEQVRISTLLEGEKTTTGTPSWPSNTLWRHIPKSRQWSSSPMDA